MSFFHGVKTNEVATSLVPPTETDAGLIVAFGTAPVHLAKNPAPANKPVLCYEYGEYVENFGSSDDFNYTLNEVAYTQFVLFNVAPIVFVNVLDTKKHFKKTTMTLGGITENPAIISAPVLLDTLSVTTKGNKIEVELEEGTDYKLTEQGDDEKYFKVELEKNFGKISLTYNLEGTAAIQTKTASDFPLDLPPGANAITLKTDKQLLEKLIEGTDYTAAYNSDDKVLFTILNAAKVKDDEVEITFHEVDVSKVTADDIIGGVDSATDEVKGLELVEKIYPMFRLVPSILISPYFSSDVKVAAAMKAKTTGINGVFRAIAIVDIPSDEVQSYTAAAEWKNSKNLVDETLIACYPKVSLGGMQYHLSTQLASLMNQVDSENDDVPYVSPSNHQLQADSSVLSSGEERIYSLTQANYLNAQGIVTALNFANGWTAWGNSTTAYPASTDPKDNFISVRRMMDWIQNSIILTYFAKVDAPMNRRLIESVVNSVNIWLNGLAAKGAILGGRVELSEKENPSTQLLSGKVIFHLYVTPAIPAQEIHFTVEYDPSYLQTLFS